MNMPKPHFQSESTKIEAYRLVHDPARLLTFLFLKYGDIDEDYYISYTNQLVYNGLSHFNITYKEHLYNYYDEFMKKYYTNKEINKIMIKLNDYYKNYLKFFSKPMFLNVYYNKIINHYYDNKAELFYINNFSKNHNSKNIKKNKKENCDSNLSSIDNDTCNDIIINKRIKKIIDNNLDSKSLTITLNINSKNDLDCINKKSISNSLITIVDYFVSKQIGTNIIENQNNKNEIQKMNEDNGDTKHNLKNENNKVLLDEQKNIKIIEKEKELSKSIKQNKNKILINSKSTDELKPKNIINIENNKYKEKERYSNIEKEKEQINKINFFIKNQNIKLFVNEKNNDEKNLNINKLKKKHF